MEKLKMLKSTTSS